MSWWDDLKYGLGFSRPPEQTINPVDPKTVNAAGGTAPDDERLATLSLFKHENDYNEAIRNAARTAGVPYAIAKGLIALESAFDERSYRFESHINDASYGLTQILSGTARGIGYTGSNDGLYDVTVNLTYGLKFLESVNSKYPVWADTLAAYNMGYPRKAADTTPLIIKIYGQPAPDWIYANQPYVDRVWAYATFYQAKDIDKDYTSAKAIFDDIRSKNIASAAKHGVIIAGAIALIVFAALKGK